MNEHELDLTLGAIGVSRTRVSATPALRERVRAVPLTTRQRRSWRSRVDDLRLQSMFSATKFVVAAAIVALFGGFLVAGVLTQRGEEAVPAAATAQPGTFSPAGSLAESRSGHTATPLSDNRVLIVGGAGGGGQERTTAEVWDPTTESFTPAGEMVMPRAWHSAVRLADGRVLIVGGEGANEDRTSAEVWDPVTESFDPVDRLTDERGWRPSTTLLPDGRVLVMGGVHETGRGAQASTEIWDPETATFSPAGEMADSRVDQTATLLPDGRVLVVGGGTYREGAPGITSAEVWDPETATFSPAGEMAEAREGHTATLLPDGRVFVVGGWTGSVPQAALAEVWDARTASFSPAGALLKLKGRGYHTATLLPDGRVLVVGGFHSDGSEPTLAEVWDPVTASFSPAGALAEARDLSTATLLEDGRVLVVGGDGAEIWSP